MMHEVVIRVYQVAQTVPLQQRRRHCDHPAGQGRVYYRAAKSFPARAWVAWPPQRPPPPP